MLLFQNVPSWENVGATVVFIGGLAAGLVGVLSYINGRREARDRRRKEDAETIEKKLAQVAEALKTELAKGFEAHNDSMQAHKSQFQLLGEKIDASTEEMKEIVLEVRSTSREFSKDADSIKGMSGQVKAINDIKGLLERLVRETRNNEDK